MDRIFLIKGKVQHYDWGGYEYIPSLLGVPNLNRIPFAEYWVGAHPSYSSIISVNEKDSLLIESINLSKEFYLGKAAAARFGQLPFLLKVLDVKEMLSIQVHPNHEQAFEGFRRENEIGIPLDAPGRSYRDDQHKPELMIALGDFWLLHGFKPAPELAMKLQQVKEFNFLVDLFINNGIEGLYRHVMAMSQADVDNALAPLANRILPLYLEGKVEKEEESYWAAKAISSSGKSKNYDRGIFSIYFFNLLHLQKGEGVYQKPQLPHAYLEGQNVELMANSDNVLRAGLTAKHIDINEVLKVTKFEPTSPNILNLSHSHIIAPAEEFSLEKINIHNEHLSRHAEAPEILLVMEGEVEVINQDTILKLNRGGSVFIIAETNYTLASNGRCCIYKASVPKV